MTNDQKPVVQVGAASPLGIGPWSFTGHWSLVIGHSSSRRRLRGFSLLEMMVAVTLLLIIIAALLAMFYQTQRAFRLSAAQVDVLESGRAAMELLAEELPEIMPSSLAGPINLYARTAYPFLTQPRPAPAPPRVNVIQDVFFIRQHNDQWIGTGYFVSSTNSNDPIGTLYRFEESVYATNLWQMPQLFIDFTNAVAQFPPTSSHRVIDRVVNLRVTPYNFLGQPTNLVTGSLWYDAMYSFTNSFDNLPSYLDLELGILEPRAYERYKALAEVSAPRASGYLANHVEKVHLFRQRIPIRTAQ